MKTIKLKLILEIEIDPQGETKDTLIHNLHRIVRDAMDNGTVTGETPATVENYEVTIE